jgi:hypothetical protein
MAANERVQRRFRNAVLIRLSKIETTVAMIHGAQLVEAVGSIPGAETKINEDAKAAQEFINQRSNELGLAMVKYIYGEQSEAPPANEKRRRGRTPG